MYNNKHHHVELMQEALILQCTCNYSLVFPPGDTIPGTSMPPPPPPLLLLLNHSQCASPSWPRTERERKLLVRDGILIPILYYNTHCTNSCTIQTYWGLVITTVNIYSMMTMTLKSVCHSPTTGCHIIGVSLSEPHTNELNGGFFIYYIYISAVCMSFRKCKLTLF